MSHFPDPCAVSSDGTRMEGKFLAKNTGIFAKLEHGVNRISIRHANEMIILLRMRPQHA